MKKTYEIDGYTFECEDVNAEGWKGITVSRNGVDQPFFGFGEKGEAAFRARCYEAYTELTAKRRK